MNNVLGDFLSTGKLAGITCGDSVIDVDRLFGTFDSEEIVLEAPYVEIRRYFGSVTIYFERNAVSGIGIYWGSGTNSPLFLSTKHLDTAINLPVDCLREYLTMHHLRYTEHDKGRVCFVHQSQVVIFTDRHDIGSVLKGCPGSYFWKDLMESEPYLRMGNLEGV